MDPVATSVGTASWMGGSPPGLLSPGRSISLAAQLLLLGFNWSTNNYPTRRAEEIPSMPSLLELESHMTSCTLLKYLQHFRLGFV